MDGEVRINKALGVSVRVTEHQGAVGYSWDDRRTYLTGELVIGGVPVFETTVSHLDWMMDGREDEVIEHVLTEFRDKLEGETG